MEWPNYDPKFCQRVWQQLGENAFVHVSAYRRLESETMSQQENGQVDSLGKNLKRLLFWSSVSRDEKKRNAFHQCLVPLLQNRPLNLGTSRAVGDETNDVVKDQKTKPHQMFLSSHSPLFAMDHYHDVKMNTGQTIVERLEKSKMPYFGKVVPAPSPDSPSGQLLWQNFIRIPDPIVKKAGLKQGDLLFFKNDEEGSISLLDENSFEEYLNPATYEE